VFREALDAPALIGMSFIIVGVAIINLLSKSVSH
jgi:multidrug transporter EmrE-like cation transporter